MGELPRNSQASFSGASSPTLPLPLPTTGAFRHSRGRKSGLHLRTRTDEEETDREEGYDHDTTRGDKRGGDRKEGRSTPGMDSPFLRLSLRLRCLLTKQAASVLKRMAAARKQMVATMPASTGRARPSSVRSG